MWSGYLSQRAIISTHVTATHPLLSTRWSCYNRGVLRRWMIESKAATERRGEVLEPQSKTPRTMLFYVLHLKKVTLATQVSWVSESCSSCDRLRCDYLFNTTSICNQTSEIREWLNVGTCGLWSWTNEPDFGVQSTYCVGISQSPSNPKYVELSVHYHSAE